MLQGLRRASRRSLIAGSTTAAALALAVGVAGATVVGIPINPFGTNQVGTQASGRILLPDDQWIAPYGQRSTFLAQSIGFATSPDGTKVAMQVGGPYGTPSIEILDAATGTIFQSFGGDGTTPPVYSPDGTALFTATGFSTQHGKANSILKYTVGPDGLVMNPTSPQSLSLPSLADLPYGLAVSPDGTKLYVALSGSNELGVIDTQTFQIVDRIPVGNAPQSVAIVGNEAFVANRGGGPAVAGDTTNNSDGTPIVSDPVTGASITGTVSVVNLATNTVTDTISVGLQPASLSVHDGDVFVTNTNSDTVSILDAASHQVTQTFNVEPLPGSTVGAAPNSVSFADPHHLLVSVGRDNAVAVFGYNGPVTPVQYQGLIPADWYPNQVQYDAKVGKVLVSNENGMGTDGNDLSYVNKGTLTSFTMPTNTTLGTLTHQVFDDNSWNHVPPPHVSPAAPQSGQMPPIPQQLGQPSAIKHVFLIIKENRTYDQVLGDIGKGNSDVADTNYGAQVTPNEHSLANTFGLFDNFYDSGMVSGDGHQWLTQADANDYIQQQTAADWGRGYPYPGGDALVYQPDGFSWNTAEAAGKTVKNYGEYEALSSGSLGSWQQYYEDSQILEGKAAGPLPVPVNQFQSYSDVPSLNAISNPDYPNFQLNIPDQYRVDIWEQDFRQAERTGNLPDLTIMWLPDDHTGGLPSPQAQVADNDLAVGRVVSDISHSQFWNDSAIFAVEDDTSAGVDHVDGHRGPLWIASPYAKRGVIDNNYYTQINVVKTIEQILGAQPMNQMDRAAVPMFDAFTNKPNFTPYNTAPNQIPLTEGVTGMTPLPPTAANSGPPAPAVPAHEQSVAAAWSKWYTTEAESKLTGPHAAPDSVNPAQMNRYDWYTSTGWTKPFPGDKQILTPDRVPGRNLTTDFSGD